MKTKLLQSLEEQIKMVLFSGTYTKEEKVIRLRTITQTADTLESNEVITRKDWRRLIEIISNAIIFLNEGEN